MVKVALSLLFIALIGSDETDYNSAYVDYCTMINEGHWPNYKEWECET